MNQTMLTPTTRLRLQGIIHRIGSDEAVSLDERIYLQKFADRDPCVAGWLRQAHRRRQAGPDRGLGRLLADLDLGEVDPSPPFRPERGDDLGEWFSGAPDWLRRS
jgi:hypothetical protein